jgi:hypothetical protein
MIIWSMFEFPPNFLSFDKEQDKQLLEKRRELTQPRRSFRQHRFLPFPKMDPLSAFAAQGFGFQEEEQVMEEDQEPQEQEYQEAQEQEYQEPGEPDEPQVSHLRFISSKMIWLSCRFLLQVFLIFLPIL